METEALDVRKSNVTRMKCKTYRDLDYSSIASNESIVESGSKEILNFIVSNLYKELDRSSKELIEAREEIKRSRLYNQNIQNKKDAKIKSLKKEVENLKKQLSERNVIIPLRPNRNNVVSSTTTAALHHNVANSKVKTSETMTKIKASTDPKKTTTETTTKVTEKTKTDEFINNLFKKTQYNLRSRSIAVKSREK